MTATVPQSPHFGYQSHHNYSSNLGSYVANHSLPNGPTRLAPSRNFPDTTPSAARNSVTSSSSRQLPRPMNMPPTNSSSALQSSSRKREREGPDWDEFYKNGPPKEIIVIDDDSPDPPLRKKENSRVNTARVPDRGGARPAAKKRRTTNQDTYDRNDHPLYSNARTYSLGASGSNTQSTDRTSLQTTAPTSLGSHSSHGNNGAYLEDGAVGQKRKRVTRGQIAVEKKQKEIAAMETYHPPPKPPIKAKDVNVPVVRDVRTPSSSMRMY